MLKLLRKNKQWLFVGAMAFLAVMWLVPSIGGGNQNAADQMKEKVGSIGDQKLTLLDINIAELEYDTIKSQFRGLITLDTMVGVTVENATHWLLLCREAEQAGLIGGPTDGEDWIPSLAKTAALEETRRIVQQNPYQAMALIQAKQKYKEMYEKAPQQFVAIFYQLLEDEFTTFLKQAQIQGNGHMLQARHLFPDFQSTPFDQAMAKVRGVRRLTNSFFGAARTSDKRLEKNAVESYDQAIVDYVLIPADRIKREIEEPTAEQLQAHFEKYKATMPGTGELGIGYFQPDGVKLEYLKIDRAAITNAIKVDEVEVNKRWRSNREKFKGEFAEERPKIETEMKAEQVKKAMSEAVRIARAEITRAVKKLPDDGAYKVLPADWDTKRIRLEDIAKAVQAGLKTSQGLEIQEPLVTLKTGSWLGPKEVNALEGISSASTPIGVKQENFVQLISHLKEATGRNDYALQIGIPYPTDKPLEGSDGSAYFFVVTAYKKPGPAETLDEVKSQAIDDFKLIGAFEKLKAEQQKYVDKAVAEGIDGVARSFERPPLDPKTGAGGEPGLTVKKLAQMDLNRVIVGGRQDQMMEVKEYLQQIRAIAKTIDPKAPPALGDLAKGEAMRGRYLAFPMPQAKGLSISFVVASRPVTVETLRAVGVGAEERSLALMEVIKEARSADGKDQGEGPFRFATMKQRMRYVLTKELKVEEQKPETPKTEAGVTGEPVGNTGATGPDTSKKK